MSYDTAIAFIFFNTACVIFVLLSWWFLRGWWATVKFMFRVNVAQAFLEQSLDNHDRKRKKRKKK